MSAVGAARANTDSAAANVDRAAAAVNEAKANVASAQAALDSANAELAYQTNNFHRIEPLLAKQFVTVDQVDQARTAVTARQQTVQQLRSQLLSSAGPGGIRAGPIRADKGRAWSKAMRNSTNRNTAC